MRYLFYLTPLAMALVVSLSTSATSQDIQSLSPDPIPVFQPGADVSSPTIIPFTANIPASKQCKGNLKGKVLLGAIIDSEGKARNLRFLNPAQAPATSDHPDLDKLALLIANSDRFHPAIRAGSPVAVAQAIELQITACILSNDKSTGTRVETVHLKALPQQNLLPYPDGPHTAIFGDNPAQNEDPAHGPWRLYQVGKDVTAPKLLRYAEAHFTEEARRKKVEGTVVVSLIVDSNGLPRKIKVSRSLGTGLDENAIAAVMQYRFVPALHNGQPVAVTVNVQVNYRLY